MQQAYINTDMTKTLWNKVPGVGELEILVQVVQPVQEVPELPAQEGQHVPVPQHKIFIFSRFFPQLLTRSYFIQLQ